MCNVVMGNAKPPANDRNIPTQHIATLLGATFCARLATLLRHVGWCWLKVDHFQTQLSQQHPTCCNMLRPTMMRYVALTRCDRLAGA